MKPNQMTDREAYLKNLTPEKEKMVIDKLLAKHGTLDGVVPVILFRAKDSALPPLKVRG